MKEKLNKTAKGKQQQQQQQQKLEGVSVRSSTRDTGYAAECPLIECELRGS